jgi:LysM repeat protein
MMNKHFSMLSRCWISLALLLAMLFSAPVGYSLAQDTAVLISPATSEVAVGSTTTVDIRIENVADMYGAEVHLNFDPALLEVVDADADMDGVQIQSGAFLSPDFVAQNNVDQAAGQINYAIAQMSPNQPVSGSGVLATVTFRGEVAGTSVVNFTNVILSDINGMLISAAPQGGSITVTGGETPTPTNTPTPGPTPTPTFTPTPGPSPTPTATPSVTATPTGNILGYHTVRPGETLYCIGRAYGVDPYAIASQNSILNPSIIHAGDVLAIPNAPRGLPPGRVCPRQFDGGTPPPACRWYHTVVLWENLYRIALRYGVSMWTIAEANHLFNLNYIRAGQVLCIP